MGYIKGIDGYQIFLFPKVIEDYIDEELTCRFDTVEKGHHIRYSTTYACTGCAKPQ